MSKYEGKPLLSVRESKVQRAGSTWIITVCSGPAWLAGLISREEQRMFGLFPSWSATEMHR